MVNKRFEGREETILDPDLPIVDTHQHLFVRPYIRYLLDDYLDDVAAGHNIVASVYVEAQAMLRQSGPEHLRALGEVEFANGMGAMSASGLFGPCRVAAGIIAHGDLSLGDRAADYLDQALALAPTRLRGVRQIVMSHPSEALKPLMRYSFAPGILESRDFRAGFPHLARRNLVFETAVFHTQLPELTELAGAFPETTIILNHLGMAMQVGLSATEKQATYDLWRRNLASLARHPNVFCKIGGLGLPFWGFGLENRADPTGYLELSDLWRPFVEPGIEAFGPDRCMMESNFPPDGGSCGFVPLWNALKHIVRSYTPAEKAALFSGTAVRVYRLDLEAGA